MANPGQENVSTVPTQEEASRSNGPNIPSVTGMSGLAKDSVFGDTNKDTQDKRMTTVSNGPSAGDAAFGEQDIAKLLELFLSTEATYLDLWDYVQRRRSLMVQEIDLSTQQCNNISQNLHLLPPAAQGALADVLTDKLNIRMAQQQEITRLDESVYPTREVLQQRFQVMYQANKQILWQWIQEKQWPTVTVCQDLGLPANIIQLVVEPCEDTTGVRH